jgi:hypothetical protein
MPTDPELHAKWQSRAQQHGSMSNAYKVIGLAQVLHTSMKGIVIDSDGVPTSDMKGGIALAKTTAEVKHVFGVASFRASTPWDSRCYLHCNPGGKLWNWYFLKWPMMCLPGAKGIAPELEEAYKGSSTFRL